MTTTTVLINGWWGCDETRRERDPIDWLLARRWSALPARRIRISGWLRYSVAAGRVPPLSAVVIAIDTADQERQRNRCRICARRRCARPQNHAAVTMMKAEKKKCSRVGSITHSIRRRLRISERSAFPLCSSVWRARRRPGCRCFNFITRRLIYLREVAAHFRSVADDVVVDADEIPSAL